MPEAVAQNARSCCPECQKLLPIDGQGPRLPEDQGFESRFDVLLELPIQPPLHSRQNERVKKAARLAALPLFGIPSSGSSHWWRKLSSAFESNCWRNSRLIHWAMMCSLLQPAPPQNQHFEGV